MPTHTPTREGSPGADLDNVETLIEALRTAVGRGTGGLVYVRADGTELRQDYGELEAEAARIARGLRAQGVKPGDPVLLQLEASEDFFPGFWGCVLAGAIAVPAAVAPTFSHPSSALQKLLNAGKLLERAPVLAGGAAVEGLRALPARLGTLGGKVFDLRELRQTVWQEALPRLGAEHVAVLLLTSGSTGQPKGVPLTHRNLLAMARGTIAANGFTAGEVTLNWMALDHVGSISFLGTMAAALGCTQIHVPTAYILQEPLRWLDLISRHRATISWAPNFAFTLFLDRAAAVQAGAWDLSSMRFLVNAGEPVVARTARKFVTLLQTHGLPVGALRPAFGMSETCSGITWSRGLTLENTTDDLAFVDLGPAIPGAEMRVVSETGVELQEGESGMLQLRGASVFSGYYRNAEENARAFKDGWFETGDLAFLKGGCLRIAGRLKDVIIVNGANFYCHEIESAAENVAGLLKTYTAACAVRDAAAETDQLALFFCLEPEQRGNVDTTARALRARLLQQVGLAPAYLIALETSEVPKTEIGKIQRAQLKKAFEAGAYRDRVIQATRAHASRTPRKRAKSRGELATAIAEIWQEVLGLDRVGHDETFFELGGHSLLIVQVQVRLQELMGRAVPVVELFNCPTVRAMADHFAKDFATQAAGGVEVSAAGAARSRTQDGDIAIIGIGLRFPGASNPAEFWRVLAEGREAITFFTAEQALAAGVDPDLVRNPNHVRAAPLLDAPDAFDAEFFRYSAKEARMIDPQQRVFLEVCWEAFEDAGYDPLTFPGKVGLFAASGMNAYLPNNLWANDKFLQDENGGRMLTVDSMNGFNVMITNDKDYLPMRVSYKLNLRGPSVNVQSACSSTLLTLHEACKSLRAGDCEMALAGGVSIKLPQHAGHLYSPGMLNSPDGHCRAYDEKAEGTIFGNGAGVVLLKPLAAAQAAGDRIYGVVKGTASNNDGGGKVGFTAPSSVGQEDVCAEAMARAGVSAESVTFMEGHGTGTALGDPIEVNALSSAFRRQTSRSGFCALGSVKTNVGHLQIASGIAGLIKTTLALHHRRIPGTLHFEKPNPRIDFSTTPFFVTRETADWVSPHAPRRAGVNSLGIGGTNVHAILEEAPLPVPVVPARASGPWVLPLSARQPVALRQLAARYADHIARADSGSLEDITFTAQVGRAALSVRRAFVADSREDLVAQLKVFAAEQTELPEPVDFDQRGLAFYFAAASGASLDQARRLWADEPVFRQAAEQCLACLEEVSAQPIARVAAEMALRAAFAPGGGPLTDAFRFVYASALSELLASYGIEPTAMSGDGVGEIVSACRAEVFSTEDALRLVAAGERWRSGARGADEEAALCRAVAEIEFSLPSRRVASGRDGQWREAELATAEYWVQHAKAGLEGNAGLSALATEGFKVVVEIGALEPVGNDARQQLRADDFPRLLGTLFTLGFPVRWQQGRQSRPARRVALPTYAWQHQSYWIEAVDLRTPRNGVSPSAAPALLGRRWRSPRVKSSVYETCFDPAELAYLAEHRVHGAIVVPGALYLSQVALQAADLLRSSAGSDRGVRLVDVVFVNAMVIDSLHPRTVQTVFTPDGDGQSFEVISWTEAEPDTVLVHAVGRCQVQRLESATVELTRVRGRLQPIADIAQRHYAVMDKMEVRLGPSFRWIGELHRGERESLLRLEAPAGLERCREWHPGLVDSFLQAAVSAIGLDGARTLIPFRVGGVCFHREPDGRALYAHAQQATTEAAAGARADVRLYDADGRLIAEALGFELRSMEPQDLASAGSAAAMPKFFETTLEPLAAPSASEHGGAAGAWLFLSEGDPSTRALQRALQAAGATIREVPVARAGEAERLLATERWAGVVHAWDMSATQPSALRWRELLASVKAAAGQPGMAARWVFLTRSGAGALAQSPLAGFVMGLAHEHSDWRPLQIEIEGSEADVAQWVPWLLDTNGSERRLTSRAGVVCGQRLVEKNIVATTKPIRADGSYLVTGAGGALGQAVAEWLVEQGARWLYLTGRRPASEELLAKIASWARQGVRASFVVADVSEARSVRELVQQAAALAPLRGVFHAAGALRDGLLRQAEVGAFTSIFGAKIGAAWELHQATKDQPLECFVLFSSIASLLGSPGQANYAAANAFMDALALERQTAGLPALSIQWGPWGSIGMTARLALRDRERLQARGLLAMAPAEALHALQQVLGLSGVVGVFAWNRQVYREALNGHLPAFYHRILISETTTSAPAPARVAAAADSGYAALPMPARVDAIERLIRETVATLLGLESYLDVEREKGLFDLGIDSLTAIDLKDRLEKSLGRTLRTTIALDYPTAARMAAYLGEALYPAGGPDAARAVTPNAARPAAAAIKSPAESDLAGLSAADLEALLEQELKG